MNKNELIERIQELSKPMEPIPTGMNPRLKPLSDLHCVAFDFYGTMFISGVGDIGIDKEQNENNLKLFHQALNNTGFVVRKSAAEEGINLFKKAINEYRENHRGNKIDFPEPDIVLIWFSVLEQLIKKKLIKGKLHRDIARRFAVEYEFRFNSIWPMPGLINMLEELKEKRFLLGIISNSQFYTPLAFEALTSLRMTSAGFDKDLRVWSYQVSVKKPSLLFFERFIKLLQQKHKMGPEQVLFVGNDVLKDIKPASEFEMKTALFAGDQRSLKLRKDDPECKDVEPDIVITKLTQIPDCI